VYVHLDGGEEYVAEVNVVSVATKFTTFQLLLVLVQPVKVEWLSCYQWQFQEIKDCEFLMISSGMAFVYIFVKM